MCGSCKPDNWIRVPDEAPILCLCNSTTEYPTRKGEVEGSSPFKGSMKCLNCGKTFEKNKGSNLKNYKGFNLYCSDRCFGYIDNISRLEHLESNYKSRFLQAKSKKWIERAKKRIKKVLTDDRYNQIDIPDNYERLGEKGYLPVMRKSRQYKRLSRNYNR